MMRFLKTFALAGGILMVAAAIALTWHLHDAGTRTALKVAEENNVALARALANAMRDRILELLVDPGTAPGLHPPVIDFRADLAEYLHDLNVVKVKIYDRSGRTVFSTEEAQIGEDKSNNGGFRSAMRGDVATELTFRNKFSAFDQVIENRNVLSSYIPIVERDGHIGSVFEIYQDVTGLLTALGDRLALQTVAIGGTFLAVYLLLLLIVRSADRAAQRHHEEAVTLAISAARAESANRTKTEFLANMSHELRTPLNAILGFSDMIQREVLGPTGNPRYREYAGDINTSATHLLDIINDILDLARIEAGRIEVHAGPVALPLLGDWAQMMVRPQADAGQVTLRTRLEPGLPTVVTDERILRQIVLNLLTNAVKFTPPGGQVTLAIGRAATSGGISIAIEDTGVGMRPEDVPHALTPFGQLDNTLARRHRGTGLGLSLAHRFARLLGGEMTIRSAPGRGTVVTVDLPAGAKLPLSAAA
jgi:signal transduction histidine kinase